MVSLYFWNNIHTFHYKVKLSLKLSKRKTGMNGTIKKMKHTPEEKLSMILSECVISIYEHI